MELVDHVELMLALQPPEKLADAPQIFELSHRGAGSAANDLMQSDIPGERTEQLGVYVGDMEAMAALRQPLDLLMRDQAVAMRAMIGDEVRWMRNENSQGSQDGVGSRAAGNFAPER